MEQINLFQSDMKWKVWTENETVSDPGHYTSVKHDMVIYDFQRNWLTGFYWWCDSSSINFVAYQFVCHIAAGKY